MASGPTCRAKRPNTWLHRPMLHTFKKVLANSEPSTHGGKADIALCTAHVLLTQSGHYLFLQQPLPVCSFDDDTIPCLEPHGAHPAARAHHAIRWGGSREELGQGRAYSRSDRPVVWRVG